MPSDKRARQRAQRAARMRQLQEAQRRRRRNRRTIPIIVIVIAIAVALAIVTGTSGSKKKSSTSTTTSSASTTATTAPGTPPTAAPIKDASTLKGATPCPKFDGSAAHVITFAQPPPDCLTAGKSYSATFVTNQGNVAVKFDTSKTPNTANNFLVLAAYHYFDGTSMFRTDTSIGIIQGGSPHTQNNADPGPGYSIKDEGTGFKYTAGDLVMARTSAANSAGSQYFFCVTSACSNLNAQGTYVTFAHVTSGLDVLQKILALNESTSGGLGGAPRVLVLVQKITITES